MCHARVVVIIIIKLLVYCPYNLFLLLIINIIIITIIIIIIIIMIKFETLDSPSPHPQVPTEPVLLEPVINLNPDKIPGTFGGHATKVADEPATKKRPINARLGLRN